MSFNVPHNKNRTNLDLANKKTTIRYLLFCHPNTFSTSALNPSVISDALQEFTNLYSPAPKEQMAVTVPFPIIINKKRSYTAKNSIKLMSKFVTKL